MFKITPLMLFFVSQLITSLTELTTFPLEKTFLGLSALWMAQRKSLLIVCLCCPSLLFSHLNLFSTPFQTVFFNTWHYAFLFLTLSESHLSILHHHCANQAEHLQSFCRDTSVLCDRAGRYNLKPTIFVRYREVLIWTAVGFVLLLLHRIGL